MVERLEIPPPWIPSLEAPNDTQYFDNYPDSTGIPPIPTAEEQDLFKNF
jgi:hypothetical protein